MTGGDLLARVDAYLDVVQRDSADVEQVGPFSLFVSRAPYPLYARPRHGATVEVTVDDLAVLGKRCDEVGVPLAVEWVEEVTPSLAGAVREAQLAVERYPLLVLTADRYRPATVADGITIGTASTSAEFAVARAVAHVAFGNGGTAVGPAGTGERDSTAGASDPDQLAYFVDDAAAGRTVTITAATATDGVVASGLVKPVDGAAEIMGVATLPAFRRRGLGLAVTSALVDIAFERGVELLLLSADSDDVARVYERLGFTRIGHTGQAERAEPPES